MADSDDDSLDAERKRLVELLDQGIASVDAGRIVSKEEMRRRLDAIRKEPIERPTRRLKHR
jgi:hypothetical protein